MITVNYQCGGCDQKATSGILNRSFVSINGKRYGFGAYVYPSIKDHAPEGWVAFDPYTGCCYCPECWSSIENGTVAEMETVVEVVHK